MAMAPWHDGAVMTQLPSYSQDHGLARGPFVAAVTAIYLVSFASQILLSAPVTSRLSVAPFVVAQTVLIWLWIVVHRRRLRDAGRPGGVVIGIAMVYALEAVLLTLLIWILTSGSGEGTVAGDGASIFHLFTVLYLIAMTTGESHLAGVQMWLMGFVALMFLPVLIAIVFSLWAATRPSAPAPQR
jgi:uncharacterized membrane protein YhaH (DUF805 family)